jgi:hypothetical protein
MSLGHSKGKHKVAGVNYIKDEIEAIEPMQ